MNGKMHALSNCQLYVSAPAKATQGAVLLIHEWWGLTGAVKKQADDWAALGYWAGAVDLFDGKSTDNRETAARLMNESQAPVCLEKLKTALQWMKDPKQEVKATRLATIGWCFGGGLSLQCALLYPELVQGAAIYYGQVETDPKVLAKCRVPLFGVFATKDDWITPELVEAFKEACQKAQVNLEVHEYEAGHAFLNSANASYDAEMAKDAYEKNIRFVHRVLH